jgi:hypothetical protein
MMPSAYAMRWIVGGKAAQSRAASPSQMGCFETHWLAAAVNLSALAGLLLAWLYRGNTRVAQSLPRPRGVGYGPPPTPFM